MILDHNSTIGQQNQQKRRVSVAMLMRIFAPQGGLELYAHRLVEGLLERGCNVTVLCQTSTSSLSHANLRVIQLPPRPKHLKKRDQLHYYFSEFTRLAEENGPFDVVHSQHVPVKDPDVVHFHNHTLHQVIKAGKSWESLLNKFKLSFAPSYRERDKYDRLLASRAKILIFPSNICKLDYENSYDLLSFRDSASHLVAYPGADPVKPSAQQFPQSSNKGDASSPFNFLFTGKGFRKKGLDILLSACQILAKDAVNFQLSIAGLKEKPIDRLRLTAYGLTKHVRYLGFQHDMSQVFANARAIVLPSRVEPFGMAPLEAMNYKLVPIVSRNSGVSEILTHKKDGLILEDHLNAKELAGLMASLLNDHKQNAALSEQAELTARNYRWSHTVNVVLNSYAAILRARKKDGLELVDLSPIVV